MGSPIKKRSMRKFWIIIFCKFYWWLKAEFNAMGLLTALQAINVLTIIGYYKIFVEGSNEILIPKVYEILIGFAIGLVNYIFFLKNKKYEQINSEFRKDSVLSGKRGTAITAFYIFLTLAFVFSLAWIGKK